MRYKKEQTLKAVSLYQMNLNILLLSHLKKKTSSEKLAHVITTSTGDRKIPVVASKGSASWVDEEGTINDSDDAFTQVSIGAYKLGTLIKVSNELLNDSVFNLEAYISKEFGRRIGTKEEDAFFNGNGVGKPVGIFNATGGAQTGITTAVQLRLKPMKLSIYSILLKLLTEKKLCGLLMIQQLRLSENLRMRTVITYGNLL